jgi:hypothetical protein
VNWHPVRLGDREDPEEVRRRLPARLVRAEVARVVVAVRAEVAEVAGVAEAVSAVAGADGLGVAVRAARCPAESLLVARGL